MRSDAIVAVATPRGRGGIAVVRVSGEGAGASVLRHLSATILPARRAVYCLFDEIDDVVATRYEAPHSYTGEEVVEVACHGSEYVQQAIVQRLIDDGLRLAEPGEFTLRAFRNGRLNLSQAEAVADLIDATTPAQHRLAVSQLRGGYADRLESLRQQMIDLMALLELELDFSQEDVEFADRTQLRHLVEEMSQEVGRLVGSFRAGNALKRGVAVAIVGRPNVGKSSLLNALLADDRSIVSDQPGTTRDTIEESATFDGITFRFIDTAGVRHATDAVEAMGVERSRRAMMKADMVLLVTEAADRGGVEVPEAVLHKVIRVCNKCDIAQPQEWEGVCVSAKTGMGIDRLLRAMRQVVQEDMGGAEEVMVANVRHYDALVQVDKALVLVRHGLDNGLGADLLAIDMREALYHVGTITGAVASDDILNSVFSRFCIGK